MEERHNLRQIDEMLATEDKGVSTTSRSAEGGGVLARLYRKFLLTENITAMQWRTYMDHYVKSVEQSQGAWRQGNFSIKGNMTKALSKDELTWKTFIRAMRFLKTKRLVITVERTDSMGRTHVVKEEMYFNPRHDPTPIENDKEDEDDQD